MINGSDDIAGWGMLKRIFVGHARAILVSIITNPSVTTLWAVAAYSGYMSYSAKAALDDAAEFAYRWQTAGVTLNATLTAGLYSLISVVSAGFALVLMKMKMAIAALKPPPLGDGVEAQVIPEDSRFDRQARAAEKRFDDGDITAAEYRAAIAEIERRRWASRASADRAS